MRALAALVVLLGSSLAPGAPASLDREYTVSQLQATGQRLALVQHELESAPGGRAQWAPVLQELASARAELDELVRQVRVAPSVAPGVVVRPQAQPAVLTPIGDATLRALVNQINAAPLADDKLRILQEAAAGNWFLADQVARVLPAFIRSGDRLNALQSIAGQILDRANNFKLLSAFPAAGDRERAQQILQQAAPLRAQ